MKLVISNAPKEEYVFIDNVSESNIVAFKDGHYIYQLVRPSFDNDPQYQFVIVNHACIWTHRFPKNKIRKDAINSATSLGFKVYQFENYFEFLDWCRKNHNA